jgi:hypothetical protein
MVTAEVMNRLPVNENYRFRCSPEAFDLWYSCVAFRHRQNVAKRVYRLEPWDEQHIHRDYGTPTTTVADLLEVYHLSQKMGTTEVSDAILDDFAKILIDENALIAKHRIGEATLQDCAVVVCFMSFDIEDINLLWEQTEPEDPMRDLILHVLWHHKEISVHTIEVQKSSLNAEFLHAWRDYISSLEDIYKNVPVDHGDVAYRIAPGYVNNLIGGVTGATFDDFCHDYHNHHKEGLPCFRTQPESSSLIPEHADTPPKTVMVRFNDVLYAIEDRASCPGFECDFDPVVERKSDWDWQRIQSIAAHVVGPLDAEDGEERDCKLRPTYYDPSTVDEYGRYPSHPGYRHRDWIQPDLDFEEPPEPDRYQKPWAAVITQGIPAGATKYREKHVDAKINGKDVKITTDVFFGIKDPTWYPPSDWEPDMKRGALWSGEFREYRKWKWVQEGGRIPRIMAKRFRPHEDDAPTWKDPFVDRKDMRCLQDLL